MIDCSNWRIISMTVLIIFLLVNQLLCREVQSKDIIVILENEEDVIVTGTNFDNLSVKCDYSGEFQTIDFEWKKIENNLFEKFESNKILKKSQWLNLSEENNDFGQYSCSINGYNGNETFSEKRGFVFKHANIGDFYDEFWEEKKPVLIFKKDSMTENVPLLLNGSLHLDCPFESSSDTLMTWYKNDKLLIERKLITSYSIYIDNTYNSKEPVRLSDAGNYTCVVQNSFGSMQHTFTVVVYEDGNKMPLSFEYPRDWSLKSGDTARFYCHAFHHPNDERSILKWYYLNSTKPRDEVIKTLDLLKLQGVESNLNVTIEDYKLILDHITVHDAGWYICILRDLGDHSYTVAAAKLEVDKA